MASESKSHEFGHILTSHEIPQHLTLIGIVTPSISKYRLACRRCMNPLPTTIRIRHAKARRVQRSISPASFSGWWLWLVLCGTVQWDQCKVRKLRGLHLSYSSRFNFLPSVRAPLLIGPPFDLHRRRGSRQRDVGRRTSSRDIETDTDGEPQLGNSVETHLRVLDPDLRVGLKSEEWSPPTGNPGRLEEIRNYKRGSR